MSNARTSGYVQEIEDARATLLIAERDAFNTDLFEDALADDNLKREVAKGIDAMVQSGIWFSDAGLHDAIQAWSLVEAIRRNGGVYPPELEA
ncbi:hypothetical protein HOU02_gp245 [Caulobacter phage CcrBL9]|uniref:Uncharacterized protein n=1 Tax=Caulobacter phage CcrBL9 TaxID=2283270 RepID=A0A385ECV1_9CAUD|nr:hypothetical protein HOU02_gp245 [Caulobacter phage CcrBL9]AXQ69480.1 hypothetical protein CcrBL9_gp456 [Caulobacter phage CcrBL9]